MLKGDIQLDCCRCRDEAGRVYNAYIATHIPTGIRRRYDCRELSGKEKNRKHNEVLREIEDEIIELKLYEYVIPDPLSYRWKRFE